MRLLLLAAVLCACKATGTFKCMTSDQCRLGDEVGYCEDSGYCTFIDDTCPSQRRYDDTAEYPLTNECLTGYVTGRIVEQYIVTDDTGARTLVPLVPSPLTLAAELEDGSVPVVRIDHDGAFSFPAPEGMPYELTNPVTSPLQTDSRHLALSSVIPGRPDVAPITKPTPIKFTFNGTSMGPIWISSSGVATETHTTVNGTNFQFDWRDAEPQQGAKLGLLDASKHDELYVTQTMTAVGYVTLSTFAKLQPTLSDGITTDITGMLTPLPRLDCAHIQIAVAAEQMRMKTAKPSVTIQNTTWQLQAATARDTTWIATYLVADSTGAMATPELDVTYANPFPSTSMLALQYVEGSVTASIAGLPVTLSVTSQTYVPFESVTGTCSATVAIAGTTAFAGEITVAGTRVDTDAKDVTIDLTKRVPVGWTPIVSGPADAWFVSIYEGADDGLGALVFTYVHTIETTETHVTIPANMLKSGHHYVVNIAALQGLPNAATGDFMTVKYPVGATSTWSRSFKVK
ncbi:MAG TPA: hypothetical protein VMZ53_29310 [Kofleriaceae bacterium]|nr:hypothetical protein [Kofleriaceae bacterium]